MEVGEGRGHADDAVSLLITVVRGRRRPLSRPNYRRRSVIIVVCVRLRCMRRLRSLS